MQWTRIVDAAGANSRVGLRSVVDHRVVVDNELATTRVPEHATHHGDAQQWGMQCELNRVELAAFVTIM